MASRSTIETSRALLLSATLVAAAPTHAAEPCRAEEIAAVIDRTGAELRRHASETQPVLLARMRQLAQRRGWPEADAEARSYALLADAESRRDDERAGELLTRLDRLGDVRPGQADICTRLQEVKAVASQLVETTAARSAHLSARLDSILRRPGSPGAVEAQPAARPPAAVEREASHAPVSPPAAPRAAPKPPRPGWNTETHREEPLPPVVIEKADPAPAQPPTGLSPREPTAVELEYSVAEIQAAGRGLFGTVSAGLAGVIEHAFSRYGRPNGYITGSEGGAAFFAGLRYGEGTLVTKLAGERKVYWQGPSVGSDFGIAGARTLMLVYNLKSPDEILTRFGGVEGSAFLVGGVGITFLAKGRVVLAPIRSGVGVRLGASIGYLKFTERPSLNPF